LITLKNRENLASGAQKGSENRPFCGGVRSKRGEILAKRIRFLTKREPEFAWTWPRIGVIECENVRELAQFCAISSGFDCLMRRFDRV
jgi:hypothetical protein